MALNGIVLHPPANSPNPAAEWDLAAAFAEAGQDAGRIAVLQAADAAPGAIRAINAAILSAIADKADLVIADGGYSLFPGALDGLLAAVAGDPMILCAGARSGNSLITGLPRPLPGEDREACRIAFEKTRPRLAVRSYVPILTPSCAYLRTPFLREIGGLDEAYRFWENALDDLLMRANRYGFRGVLANRAYAYSPQPHAAPDCREDKALLHERYPELDSAVPDYLASPERRAEELLAAAAGPRPVIAFDFSYFSAAHDGTNEAGLRLLAAARASWTDCDLAVVARQEIRDAFRLNDMPGLRFIDPEDRSATAAAVLRIGQPWLRDELPRLFRLAPVVGIFMLDAIGYDCLYNAVHARDLRSIWTFACEFADVIFTQSEFTAKRLHERFTFGPHCETVVSRHSLDLAEYCTETSTNRQYVLVIGNTFHHKFLARTIDALAPAFPEKRFVVIGAGESRHPNVTAHASGKFSEEAFSRLYLDAECIIFPSVYEGFGFPILHGLARGKVVYARDGDLNRELSPLIRHGKNLRLYEDTQELAAMLRTADSAFSPDLLPSGETGGWERSAGEIKAALDKKSGDICCARVATRLRWCEAVFAQSPGAEENAPGQP